MIRVASQSLNRIRLAWILVGLFLPVFGAAQGVPRHPFPQHVTYATGTIRPSHRTQEQLDEDARAAYVQWKSNYLVGAGAELSGAPRYRVQTDADDPVGAYRTASEGHGYGMMIVPLMAGADPDARTLFDGLWYYFDDHRSEIDHRLMDGSVPADESLSPGMDNTAFDGDCDIAFGLLLAAEQWGSGGAIDYATQARSVIAGILESEIGVDSHWPMLGDWVNFFSDDPVHNQYTPRTSDFMLDHFRAFARATGDSRWMQVHAACVSATEQLQADYAPGTGLLPDFAEPLTAGSAILKPAHAGFLGGDRDGDYSFNACRVPWRLGTDGLLSGDTAVLAAAAKIAAWSETKTSGNPDQLREGYHLDGTNLPPDSGFNTVFAAPLAVGAMTDPARQTWLNSLDDAVRTVHQKYYEDTVTLLCLIVMSRNYWDPSAPPPTLEEHLIRYLLGMEPETTGLDVNGDSAINVADLIAARL